MSTSSSTEHEPRSVARRLIFLRHAKSSWSEPGMADFDRPLNHRGRESAPAMGKKLRDEQIAVDIILASTAARVRQTLDLLLPTWHWHGPIAWEKSLYLASPETIGRHIASLDEQWHSAMIVGHNPGLSETVSQLTGRAIEMPTGAVAVLESSTQHIPWPNALRATHWHLKAFWKPKEL
jgi:phosphohistidine phosphatase